MKIVLSEHQFKNLYEIEERPMLVDVDFIIEVEQDDEELNLGGEGEPNKEGLYFFNIGEKFYDKFYDETYLELFDSFSKEKECDSFVDAVIQKMLEKIKKSVLDNTASKILKGAIKNQKVIKFRLIDIQYIFERHFGHIMCHEFLQDIK